MVEQEKNKEKKKKKKKVLPRLELGSSGSEPEVLTNYTIEPPYVLMLANSPF
jgi:hypothetical protein